MHPNPSPRRARVAASVTCLAVLAGLALGACEATTGPVGGLLVIPDGADEAVPDTLRARYQEDAARLAVRLLRETGAPGADAVEIPAAYTTSFYNALAAVHALDHPARDAVVETYRIHTFPNPPLYELLVALDTTFAWARALRDGRSPTGDAGVDSLVQAYGLVVAESFPGAGYTIAVLRAAAPLNIAALGDRFARIAGVRFAEPNTTGGDGADIVARAEAGDAIRLDYSIGYGDCPAGCIYRHTWSFRVDDEGEVRYLGGSGDPVPDA